MKGTVDNLARREPFSYEVSAGKKMSVTWYTKRWAFLLLGFSFSAIVCGVIGLLRG